MTAPNPLSAVIELDYELQKSLLSLLDENGAWKLIAVASGILSQTNILCIEKQSTSPSWDLLMELHNKLCTVGTLCYLLEQCKLYHILALLKDREPVVIRKEPGNGLTHRATLYVPLGGMLQLECDATGLPPPTYVWYHENAEVANQPTGKLCIKDFKHMDEGDYYCCVQQAWNNESYEVYSTKVHVRLLPEPPSVTKQPPASILCPEGDDIVISCVVRGYPKPEMQWFHKNRLLEDHNTNTLTISNIEMNQNGEYRCYIKNEAGELWTNSTQVNAYKRPDIMGKKSSSRHMPTEKVALLIGNSIYRESESLKSPTDDVIILANRLSQLNFKVIALQNLTLTEMKNAVSEFCKLLPKGAYVLFYFAGHGFEMQDKYMLPVNAPGPDKYLRSDSLCERQVIRDVLDTKPKLFVILLDMCLRVPNVEENPDIHAELPEVFQYTPERNLVQGYATTSNLGAYERETEENGIYVKHLEEELLCDDPITKILERVCYKVSIDRTDVAEKQIPFYSANVVDNLCLTHPIVKDQENEKTEERFRALNKLPPDTSIIFCKVNTVAELKMFPVECFQNALEIRIRKLDAWILSCDTDCTGVEVEIPRQEIDVKHKILRVYNLQKITNSLRLTLSLHKANGQLMDNAILDLGLPLIAPAELWFDKTSIRT